MQKQLLNLTLFFLIAAYCNGQTVRKGKDYAVLFYVAQQESTQYWKNLPKTKTEVEKIKAELKENYGFDCRVVVNPTKEDMLNVLDEYNAKTYGSNDQLMLFFSMHGFFNAQQNTGFLIPRNGTKNWRSWLSYDNLRATLAINKCNHIFLALDACYSGSFGIRDKAPEKPPWEIEPECKEKVSKAMEYKSRLFACAGNKESKTPGESLFASKFLEALRRGGQDGILSNWDIRGYFRRIESPKPENGTFFGHEETGDFLFVKKNSCAADDNEEAKEWMKATILHTTDNYLDFLLKYPGSDYAAEARTAIKNLNNLEDSTEQPKGSIAREDNMVLIKGGTFEMGSTDGESDEKPVHTVNISDFHLSKYEVTVREFRRFVEATGHETDAEKEGHSRVYEGGKWIDKNGVNWRHDPEGNIVNDDNHPVINVSWNDAVAFCQWKGEKYRLPTEAEWEYAAGNGSKHTKYSWGDNAPNRKDGGSVADETGAEHYNWTKKSTNIFVGYQDNYINTAPIGTFNPNDFGLYDMTGNVYEWCSDWYDSDYYKNSPSANPQGAKTGSYRVVRGGGWINSPRRCRVANRSHLTPTSRSNYIGFRLARSL
jgi:sulfatase modifying factor 1